MKTIEYTHSFELKDEHKNTMEVKLERYEGVEDPYVLYFRTECLGKDFSCFSKCVTKQEMRDLGYKLLNMASLMED